jgi:hypothetical protein
MGGFYVNGTTICLQMVQIATLKPANVPWEPMLFSYFFFVSRNFPYQVVPSNFRLSSATAKITF